MTDVKARFPAGHSGEVQSDRQESAEKSMWGDGHRRRHDGHKGQKAGGKDRRPAGAW